MSRLTMSAIAPARSVGDGPISRTPGRSSRSTEARYAASNWLNQPPVTSTCRPPSASSETAPPELVRVEPGNARGDGFDQCLRAGGEHVGWAVPGLMPPVDLDRGHHPGGDLLVQRPLESA